ncbi:hypothetical protein TNCV_4849411 [Trichonephila clavipes]|nr:hypothetical protein TNCV_4849411 [Trichonephila clavipes]
MPVGTTASLSEYVHGIVLEKLRISIRFSEKFKKLAPKTFQISKEAYGDGTLSRAHMFECYQRFSGVIDSVEGDEPAWSSRSVIIDQNITKFCDMSELPLTSVVRLLINTTTMKC